MTRVGPGKPAGKGPKDRKSSKKPGDGTPLTPKDFAPLPEEILEKIPDDLKMAVHTAVHTAVSFSGPLPLPGMYEDYERVHPGAAGILLGMAQKEQEHRISQDNRSMDEKSQGQRFGFAIAVIGILTAGFVAVNGMTVAACVIAGGSLLGLVRQFLGTFRKPLNRD